MTEVNGTEFTDGTRNNGNVRKEETYLIKCFKSAFQTCLFFIYIFISLGSYAESVILWGESDRLFSCRSQFETVTLGVWKTAAKGSDSDIPDCRNKILYVKQEAACWQWSLTLRCELLQGNGRQKHSRSHSRKKVFGDFIPVHRVHGWKRQEKNTSHGCSPDSHHQPDLSVSIVVQPLQVCCDY